MNINCPNCGQPHALFWVIQKGGKRTLSYRCDKVKMFNVATKYGTIDAERTGTRTLPWPYEIPESEASQLPEEWSHGYKEQQQNKAQYQMPLMYRKDK